MLCSADLLAARLEAGIENSQGQQDGSDKRVLPFDHVYPAHTTTAEPPKVVVTLYSAIGTSEFAGFHALLKPRAQKGELRYVVRHFVPGMDDPRSVKTLLQGYGVYLDIKNMEYKNLDESSSPGQENKGASMRPILNVAGCRADTPTQSTYHSSSSPIPNPNLKQTRNPRLRSPRTSRWPGSPLPSSWIGSRVWSRSCAHSAASSSRRRAPPPAARAGLGPA